MADKNQALLDLLGVVPVVRTKAQRRGNRLRLKVASVLECHAPQVAALQGNARWDAAMQEAVRMALANEFGRGQAFNAACDHVALVIEHGNTRGLWRHRPWKRCAAIQAAPSPLKRNDGPRIATAELRLQKFLEDVLKRVVEHHDPAVITGALLVAAADCSALINERLLSQLPDAVEKVMRHGDLVFIDLPVQDEKGPRRNVRRWFLDDVSTVLVAALLTCNPSRLPDAQSALRRFCEEFHWKPLTIKELASSARARWATVLPFWLLRFCHLPALAPSLPLAAFQRLATGRPLAPHQQPVPARAAASAAAAAAAALVATNAIGVLRGRSELTETPVDLDLQRTAVTRLGSLLGTKRRDEPAGASKLLDDLHQWQRSGESRGGWLALLGLWVEDCLISYAGGGDEDEPRKPSTIQRYLSGFGSRLIEAFHELPPHLAAADAQRLANCLEQVRLSTAPLASAPTARQGLKSFLQFVHRMGGPLVTFDREWRADIRPGEADSNLLTPREYTRLLQRLGTAYSCFAVSRLRVITILSYRLGPRWGEAWSLRFKDVQLTRDACSRGAVWIRPNPFNDGKTPEAERKIRIDHLLTPGERRELKAFVELARGIRGTTRPESDYLFADPINPAKPPREEETHDVIQQAMREVSGDRSLVFHHLRHSAANVVLLRVFFGSHAEELDWIPGVECILDSAFELEPGHFVAALTGRLNDDPSRVYILSEFMGHLDPATAAHSYLHLVDLLLAAVVRRHVHLPRGIAAAMAGITEDAMRKREYRAQRR